MKSKAPFGKNTPLKKIEIFQGSTSTYRHPSTVIQPIVGAEVGKKLAEVGSKVAVDAIKAKSDKKSDGGTMIDSKGLQIPDIGDNLPKFDTKVPNLVGKSKSTSNTSDYYQKTVREILPTIGSYEGKKMSQDEWDALPSDTKRRLNAAVGADEEGNVTKPGYRVTEIKGKKQIAAVQMKGSPAKQVDPYAAINPEAVPGAQAQNVLGAQPIVGADLNQARNVDMQAMVDPYKSPGATFKPGEKINAENIYGQAGQRQALMNLGSPMHAHTPDHDKKSDSLAISKLEKKAKYPSQFKTFKEAVQARDSAHSMYKRLSKAGLNDLSTRASELENLIGQETDQGPEDFKRLKQQ